MWRTRIQSVPQSGGETHGDIDARLQILKSEHAMIVEDYDRIKSAYNSLPANFMEQRCTNRAAEASKLHDAFATGCQTQYCDCQVKRTRTFDPELPFKKSKNALEDAERSLSFGGLSSASDQLAIAKHEMEFAQGQIITLKEEIGNFLKEDDSFVWPWVYKKAAEEPDYTACPYVLKSFDTPTNIWD